MLIMDGIQNVTMANGLVGIQVVQTGADGKSKGEENGRCDAVNGFSALRCGWT